MSDLQRLRRYSTECQDEGVVELIEDVHWAADEIERLSTCYERDCETYRKERDALTERIAKLEDIKDQKNTESFALHERIAKLEGRVAVWKECSDDHEARAAKLEDDLDWVWASCHQGKYGVTLDDIRNYLKATK